MKFVSLFSGIGGLDLGLERAGHECILQVENDPYCQRVLEKHWPDVRRIADVREVTADDCKEADAIVGGFPCQPVSLAGKRQAHADPRWLWPPFQSLIASVRPRYVVVENVPGLLSSGMAELVGDLSALGYDAEWYRIAAATVGAPHLRWRIFIVAYTDQQGMQRFVEGSNTGSTGQWGVCSEENMRAITDSPFEPGNSWPTPLLRGVDARVPKRVDRLRVLGNAVVPQVAEIVGRTIPV